MESKEKLKKMVFKKLKEISSIKNVTCIEIHKDIVYLFDDMEGIIRVKDSHYGGVNLIHFYNLTYNEITYIILVNNTSFSKSGEILFIINPVDDIHETLSIDNQNYEELNAGIYLLINVNNVNDRFYCILSGDNPFLKWETTFDYNNNVVVSKDILRGKNFIWIKK